MLCVWQGNKYGGSQQCIHMYALCDNKTFGNIQRSVGLLCCSYRNGKTRENVIACIKRQERKIIAQGNQTYELKWI